MSSEHHRTNTPFSGPRHQGSGIQRHYVRWLSVGLLVLLRPACIHIPHPDEPNVPSGAVIERVRLDGAENINVSALVERLANRPPERIVLSLKYGVFARRMFRFDELQVPLDQKRIQSFYERHGYFSTKVGEPKVQPIAQQPDRLEIVWPILEGPPTTVEDVVLEGIPPEDQVRLMPLITIKENDVYQSPPFRQSESRLRASLVQDGYARAVVKGRVRIDRNAGKARVIFEIELGPLIHLDALRAAGMVRTPASAILARKTWQPGDIFTPSILDQLRGRLYAIDQYASIRLDYAPAPGQAPSDISKHTPASQTKVESPTIDLLPNDVAPVPNIGHPATKAPTGTDIIARVDEAQRNEIQMGLGGGIDQVNIYFRARTGYKRRNFPFRLSNLTVDLTPAIQFLRTENNIFGNPEFTPQGRISVLLYDFPWPLFTLESDGGFQYQQLEAYEWFGPDFGQSVRRTVFSDRLTAAVGWRFHQFGYTDARVSGPGDPPLLDDRIPSTPTPQEILNIAQDSSVSVVVLQTSLTFDGRDDGVEPTQGVFLHAQADFGFASGHNSSGFLRISPEFRGYISPDERLVLAARAYLSANMNGTLPAPFRVFTGGASSQRGFPQRRLSPLRPLINIDDRQAKLDSNGHPLLIPVGGETAVEINLEARIHLFRIFGYWFGIVGFLDSADLGQRIQDLSLPELHFAAGGGLRYLTPIGAVRLDYGYRLNRKSPEDGIFACSGAFGCGTIHFSLGQAF